MLQNRKGSREFPPHSIHAVMMLNGFRVSDGQPIGQPVQETSLSTIWEFIDRFGEKNRCIWNIFRRPDRLSIYCQCLLVDMNSEYFQQKRTMLSFQESK